MNKVGIYICGIINSNSEGFFDPCNITAGEEVFTIPYQNISAVVSKSEIVDYTHLRKDALALTLVRHQKITERIMSSGYAIIPIRLGTFAVDRNEVRHILAKGYPIIKDIFSKIKDKIEVDVAVIWSDFSSVLKETGEEKEIKELKERILTNPERITIEDRIKVGIMVKNVLNEKREKFAFQIQDDLKSLSESFKVHELMDEKMIVNMAFLINKSNSEDFDRKVEELNNKFADKLNFRCVGPLPPYSFYTLEIKKMQFEEIDWAKKKLGVNGFTIKKDEIKRAYKRLAFLSHPDKNPDKLGIEKEFDELTKAYKILVDYCQAVQQENNQDSFSFNDEEVKKDAILVKVRE